MREAAQGVELPEPKAPYSFGIWADKTFYMAGVCGINNELLSSPDIIEETHNAMHEAELILKSQNLTFDNVINARIYITNLNNIIDINNVYRSYFSQPYPSRATVQVSGLIAGANIEIVFTAYDPKR